MADCIHCGKAMVCKDGVAHHRCSRKAQRMLDIEENKLHLKTISEMASSLESYYKHVERLESQLTTATERVRELEEEILGKEVEDE